jgi:hypothetical protein
MDGLADDSVVDVLLVLLGAAAFVIGVAGLLRPGLLIKGRSAWARLLTRPFMHGRVIGGEVDPHDPLQRLITRATGILFVIVGAGLIVGGLTRTELVRRGQMNPAQVWPESPCTFPKGDRRHAAMRDRLRRIERVVSW